MEMKAVNVNLVDIFGSEVTWEIRIDQITPLTAVWFRLKLATGTLNLKSKRHTFDYTDIKGYQIKGDHGDKPAQFATVGARSQIVTHRCCCILRGGTPCTALKHREK